MADWVREEAEWQVAAQKMYLASWAQKLAESCLRAGLREGQKIQHCCWVEDEDTCVRHGLRAQVHDQRGHARRERDAVLLLLRRDAEGD